DGIGTARAMPPLHARDDSLDIVVDLRYQDHFRARRDARVHGDPARVSTHHFANDDAIVTLGRAVQAIDGIASDIDGGLVADRVLRCLEVIVDRLGNPD